MNERKQIPIDQLVESPFNPRKRFSEASLIELSHSMRADGQLQPLLVRPQWANPLRAGLEAPTSYQIVFGHRRFRAGKLADLATLDCDVRELTDAEASRAQIAENLQRDDVHAIEEAEGFGALMRDHGMTAEQLVEQTGKSRTYIYNRLKLLEAAPVIRDACLDGLFGAEVLQLFARIPGEKLQVKALQICRADYGLKNEHDAVGKIAHLGDGGTWSFRKIRDLLIDKLSLDLKDALWKLDDAELLAEAGACTACPKRSGGSPEIFADVVNNKGRAYYYGKAGANVCTDPDCFAAKKKQHLANAAAALEAKGRTVITGNKAKAALSANGQVRGTFVALADVKDALKKKKAAVEIVLLQDQRTGKTVQAVARTDVDAAGVKAPAPKSGAGRDYQAEEKKRQEQRAADEVKVEAARARRLELVVQIRDKAALVQRSDFDLRLVAHAALAGLQWLDLPMLAALWKVKETELRQLVGKLSLPELTRFVLDCGLVRDAGINWLGDANKLPQSLQAAAQHYRVPLAQAADARPAKGKGKGKAAEADSEAADAVAA